MAALCVYSIAYYRRWTAGASAEAAFCSDDIEVPIKQHMATDIITLKAKDLAVELAPRIGGSVASFQWSRPHGIIDLMRPMTQAARVNADPTGATMFPMVPYANRIADDRFDFEGCCYRFNHQHRDSSSIHGSGWRSPWNVRFADARSAELTIEHLSSDEPYSYSAFQRFCLSDDCLTVTIGVTNRGPVPLPFGFGLHPFWNREPDITVRFRSTHFWLEGPGGQSTERIATPPELDFSQSRPLPQCWRNNCYDGWDGHAEILFPRSGTGLRIEAGPLFRHLMLYSDPGERFFCLEPQTHATCALNRIEWNDDDDLGMLVLKPNESVEDAVWFMPLSG